MKIALLSCVSKKKKIPTKAKDLYVSSLFVKSKRYAELYFDDYYILSAKHGLIDKNKIISPYDLTLNNMNKKQKVFWSIKTANEINKTINPNDSINILAGSNYYEYMIRYLNTDKVSILMKNLSIGKRLQWLNENTKDY